MKNYLTIKTSMGGRRTAILGMDIRQAQRRIENKRYEMIGVTKFAHKAVLKIIEQLKSAARTQMGNSGKNWLLKN